MALNARSTGESGSVAQRRRQEEKNQQILRELLALPANRHCFECGQRGPTYANVTHGSFCCMHCSGLLRGLNPPQRVKSITMSTFTEEDLQKLRRMGNEQNRVIWLGLFEGGSGVQLDRKSQDEVRQHLVQKYEQRRWYVSPDELTEQKRLLDEYSSGKRSESNASPSILSHQSNQSAPANLISGATGGSGKGGLLDLLTGDLNELFTQPTASSVCTKPSITTTPNPPKPTMASAGSLIAAPPITAPDFSVFGADSLANRDPFSSSHTSVQAPAQQFSNIPHSSTIAFGAFPCHRQEQRVDHAGPQPDFANFETQFNTMMNLGGERMPGTNQPAKNPDMIQSASAFTLGHRPPPPPLPQMNPVVWPGQVASVRISTNRGTASQWQDDRADFGAVGEAPNGGDISKIEKSGGNESVDYSALEELYRDSSVEKSGGFSTTKLTQKHPTATDNSTKGTSFGSSAPKFDDTFGATTNWGWTTASTSSANETSAGFGISNPPIQQHHHPANNGQSSNWNPFA